MNSLTEFTGVFVLTIMAVAYSAVPERSSAAGARERIARRPKPRAARKRQDSTARAWFFRRKSFRPQIDTDLLVHELQRVGLVKRDQRLDDPRTHHLVVKILHA